MGLGPFDNDRKVALNDTVLRHSAALHMTIGLITSATKKI